MDADGPTACRTPPPTDTEGWALEVAGALEALEHEHLAVVLEDGTRLEPDDPLEAVVLVALRSRGCDLALEDIAQACADLVEFEHEAGVRAEDGYETSLDAVAWRYLLAHATLGVSEELPAPALVDAVIEQARGYAGEE